MMSKFKALVVKEIVINDIVQLSVPEDAEIVVDVNEMVAFWNDQHFDISKEEYIILN